MISTGLLLLLLLGVRFKEKDGVKGFVGDLLFKFKFNDSGALGGGIVGRVVTTVFSVVSVGVVNIFNEEDVSSLTVRLMVDDNGGGGGGGDLLLRSAFSLESDKILDILLDSAVGLPHDVRSFVSGNNGVSL